jgi:predicted nucleic acid binding AN1-type Zn finger protein
VNQNIPYEQINCVMTGEEVNDQDCECIFSSAVRLWWLTEKPGRKDRVEALAVFQSSHNKISSTRCLGCRQLFSLPKRCDY